MKRTRIVIVGGGVGGLTAAVSLAARGAEVLLFEKAQAPGGKMREVRIGTAAIDSGPTVFTMRWVFDELFAQAGTTLEQHLTLRRVETLARHAWDGGGALDLFTDARRSADAIGAFAGAADARGYLAFSEQARRIYETLEKPYIREGKPTAVSLVRANGIRRMFDTQPFSTLWQSLGQHFRDPRLRQLFGRYATYCGSSPFRAPATLMLVAHVEKEGVWLVDGGMHQVARALAALAQSKGAVFRYGAEVADVIVSGGRARGVVLRDGERVEADAVLLNADVQALGRGLFGPALRGAVPPVTQAQRSLSAVTWSMVAETEGFELLRHNVFFSKAYEAEFSAIEAGRLPPQPTVYVCAADRGDVGDAAPAGPDRLLCLVNAPARGDAGPLPEAEMAQCEERTFALMARCGLRINGTPERTVRTTPEMFNTLFPATGGGLYGTATHGAMSSFSRPTAKSRVPGLYLAGGSVHPGPGVPMAGMSGRLAAARILADLAST